MKHLRLFLVAVATVFGLGCYAQDDITSQYLTNADLSIVDNGWTYYSDAYKYQDWKTDGDVPVVEFYSQWNDGDPISINQKDFKFSQTVTLPAGDYRIAVNAFYRNGRGDGTNDNKAWIFAGDKKQNVVALTSAGVSAYSGGNDLYKAANAFSKGDFSNAFDFSLEEETQIELGFQGYFNLSLSWCILGPVKLFKYSLENYLVDYRAKVAEAKALYDIPMNADVLSALKAAVVEETSFSLGSQVAAAIQTLTQKISDANNSITAYEEAKAIIDAAKGYDSYGQASYNSDATVTAIAAAYEDRSLTTLTSDQKSAASAALATACKAQQQPADGCDMSAYIVNPSFDGGSFTGWSKDITVNGNNQAYNNTAYEYWSWTAGSGGFDYYQVINDLPEGLYSISADMFNDQVQKEGDTFAPAAGVYGSSSIGSVIKLVDVQGATFNTYTTDGLTVLDGTLRIGAKNETEVMPARWFVVDNFKLTYVRQLTEEEKVAIIKTTYEEVLATAKEAYESGVNAQAGEEGVSLNNEIKKAEPTTVEGYNAAIQALTSATAVFNAAVPAYDAYVTEKAIADEIGAPTGDAPATAAEASAKVNELKVAEFNYVKENYPYDYEPVIGTFGEWTGTATVNGAASEPNYLDREHWSGQTHAYYEQAGNGWSSNAWTVQYQKTAKLPAGDYMLKVAARSSVDVISYVKCSATDFTVALPNAGNATKGIDKSGDANFGDGEFVNNGNGFGWEWRFLPFSLTEETEVTMTFYGETNKQYNWMSIADGTLLSKQEIVNVVELKSTDATVVDATVASEVNTDRKLLKGLNTIILPFDVTAEEIGAATILEYTGTTPEEGTTTVTLNFKEVAPVDGVITLQANTPYAVFVDADQTENLAFGMKNINPADDLTTEDTNKTFDFVGTYTNLAKDNTIVKEGDMVAGEKEFKKAAGGNRIAAYRAYLKKVSSTDVNVAFNFNGEIVNGIEAVEILNRMSDDIYNLNGQKVNRTQKGIYIINGKKVIIK